MKAESRAQALDKQAPKGVSFFARRVNGTLDTWAVYRRNRDTSETLVEA